MHYIIEENLRNVFVRKLSMKTFTNTICPSGLIKRAISRINYRKRLAALTVFSAKSSILPSFPV